MKDIQSLHDSRRINIRKVGVKTLTYPITVLDKASSTQATVARFNLYVNLPHRFKGTHMSRFVEILNRFHGAFNLKTLHLILEEMKAHLVAEEAHLEIAFPYFLARSAAAGSPGMERYDCRLHGSLAARLELMMEVDVPVPPPMPPRGGDGPEVPPLAGVWGMITVSVRMNRLVWIEDLIELVEQGAAVGNGQPVTVESMCRRVSTVLQASSSFHWYKIVVKKMASGYSAFAAAEWPGPPKVTFPATCEGSPAVGVRSG